MNGRFAESSRNAVSDIVELALYSISVLLIFLLWVYVPAWRSNGTRVHPLTMPIRYVDGESPHGRHESAGLHCGGPEYGRGVAGARKPPAASCTLPAGGMR
jgi:hypothetical protein